MPFSIIKKLVWTLVTTNECGGVAGHADEYRDADGCWRHNDAMNDADKDGATLALRW